MKKLTPRETQVLDLLCVGKTHAEAGEALGIKPSTVDTFVARAKEKLGAKTTLHAAVMHATAKARGNG